MAPTSVKRDGAQFGSVSAAWKLLIQRDNHQRRTSLSHLRVGYSGNKDGEGIPRVTCHP